MSEITVTRRTPAVAVVTIARPARRNALNLAAWRDLAAAFRGLAGDRTVRLVVLTGVGGGCAIAMCCDFRVMRHGARFGIPATKLGTIYTIEECRLLLNTVGLAAAKRILYGSELRDAAAARELGFADALTEGDPVEAAIEFGAAMAANAPLAIAGTKRILHALDDGEAERRRPEIEALIRAALDSADYREGAAAFLEKRPARFTGS